jgi:hypothetical protein
VTITLVIVSVICILLAIGLGYLLHLLLHMMDGW